MNYIYAIKNLIDKKVYIGSTNCLKRRKYNHFYTLRANIHRSIHLQRAFNKYGEENFEFFMIEECLLNERKNREIHYISIYDSTNRNFGYNILEPSEEGFCCSQETIMKLRERKKCIFIPVSAYCTNGTFLGSFESVNACARALEIRSGIISEIISKKRKSYKNMVFFKEGEEFLYVPSNMQRNMTKFRK